MSSAEIYTKLCDIEELLGLNIITFQSNGNEIIGRIMTTITF